MAKMQRMKRHRGRFWNEEAFLQQQNRCCRCRCIGKTHRTHSPFRRTRKCHRHEKCPIYDLVGIQVNEGSCHECGCPIKRSDARRTTNAGLLGERIPNELEIDVIYYNDYYSEKTGVTNYLEKQNQRLLATLPKTKPISRHTDKGHTLELLFDSANRRANRIRETVHNAELELARATRQTLGSSCICVDNKCRCDADSN